MKTRMLSHKTDAGMAILGVYTDDALGAKNIFAIFFFVKINTWRLSSCFLQYSSFQFCPQNSVDLP